MSRDNMDMGCGDSAYRGVLMHLDTNKMLGLAEVKEHGVGDCPLSGFELEIVGKSIAWTLKSHVVPEGRLIFVLDSEEVKTAAARNTEPAERYLSWGCQGRFRNLRVCLAPLKMEGGLASEIEAFLAKGDSQIKQITSMQLRTQFAKAPGTRAAASKRKRETLAREEEEDEEELLPATP